MRKFIIKLRHVTFHKHRNCSTIYKWRYSLLQIYISLWLKQTKVAVQLKQSHLLRGLPRLDAGCSFAAFRSQLELSRKRRLILNSGNGFHHRYLLRFYILRWRANMAFSRCCRIFLQSIADDTLVINLAKKRVWNRWRIHCLSLQERACIDRQHEKGAMMHRTFRLQRVAMLRWLRRLTARYRHHAVIKPAVSRFLLYEGRQRRLHSHLKSWELFWLFRKQFVRSKNRLAIQQYSFRLISHRWPTFRMAVAARQRQIRASLRAEFYWTCMRYSKGIRALKLLLPYPPSTLEGVDGLRRQLLRGKLRAIIFWKAWRCSRCLAKWRALCLHFRRRREQLRAAWTEFERDTSRSTCRAIVRVATRMEERETVVSERSAVLKKVLLMWKTVVAESKLFKYRSHFVEASRQNLFENRSISKVGSVGAQISVPPNILSQQGDTQAESHHSVIGSRDQPRRSLPPPVSLPSSSRESTYGPFISSLLSSSSKVHDEVFERWRVPPRNPVFAAPYEADKNRSHSLVTIQTAVDIDSNRLSHISDSKLLDYERPSGSEGNENGQIGAVRNSELRKQLASEVLVLIQEISRCI